MKIKDIRILSEIPVISTDHRAESDNYIAKTKSLCGGVFTSSEWFQYHTCLPCYAWIFPGEETHNFTCCIVDYNATEHQDKGSINHHHALRILKKIGLKTPTLGQVIALANYLIVNDNIFDSCYQIAGFKQPVVCPVSFNPEYPDFYYFGYKVETRFRSISRFACRDYKRIPNNKGLYFGGMTVNDGRDMFRFPFLLGIKP
ncbi:hypothetical protein EB001_08245 [bacterium]|nr:hypothetical protein [bacterium]